jgi:hypothetical protein
MSMFRRLLLVWNVEHSGYLTGVRFLRRSAKETATFFRYTRPFVDVAEYTRRFSDVWPISVTVLTELPFSVFTTVVATSLDALLFDVRIEFSSLPLKQTDGIMEKIWKHRRNKKCVQYFSKGTRWAETTAGWQMNGRLGRIWKDKIEA